MTLRAAPVYVGIGLVSVAFAGQWLLGGATLHGGESGATAAASASPAAPAAPEAHLSAGASAKAAPGVSSLGVVPASRSEGHAPRIATGVVDYHGVDAGVACMTCHGTRNPDRGNGVGGALPKTFHQGLAYAHAAQSCLSCHHADDYDSLRLADGGKLAFADSQRLCAQCHGPQTRDYRHGSHGGMRGYWDRSRGERVRNTCLDCHDAHAPAYPAWTPVFPPRDAAARQQAEREARHAHE